MQTDDFTCASDDLQSLQRCAVAGHTGLTSTFRYCGVAEWNHRQGEQRSRKAVQNLCFNVSEAAQQTAAFQGLGSEPSLPSSYDGTHLSSVCGGGVCSFHHTGASCFPSLCYRAAVAEMRSAEGITERRRPGLPHDIRGDAEDAATEELGLLWSLVPPHLLISCIQTPRDAELILARLREEERLLCQPQC
ncbi:hypothetical protein ABL78_5269 [Leptomonas seymouri]|uniref:Uncharacterized protein n=1 Tax=Leptomonas seymouri TaxID=5684 RepID=A0A0N0P4T8_LEPSE|nr:hypothetical protein ABL78_5269 [Leptomonas seymouri]|eukprot:KPI85689.1 hypothetical protein ABL78_5269 [Leptomonas seymouri]